jgi:hypothetical protein
MPIPGKLIVLYTYRERWQHPHRNVSSFCGAAQFIARVAELVDALDLGSSRVTCEGSSPSFRTIHAVRLGAIDLGS